MNQEGGYYKIPKNFKCVFLENKESFQVQLNYEIFLTLLKKNLFCINYNIPYQNIFFYKCLSNICPEFHGNFKTI